MRVMESALKEVMDTAVTAIINDDQEAAKHVEPLEELIDNLSDEMKHRHIERLSKKVYSRKDSLPLNDLIIYYERISDHCSNIAIAVIELDNDEFDVHNYVESLMNQKNEEFDRYFDEYRLKYRFDAEDDAQMNFLNQ